MRKKSQDSIKSLASWQRLAGVYKSDSLQKQLSAIEKKYRIKDQRAFFAKLVNTSLSRHQEYHRWVRYREGYAGDLVKEVLHRYPNLSKKHYVLDPTCGSGSTVVACCQLGLNSIGADVNPYAVLATEVKAYSLSKSEVKLLRETAQRVVRNAKSKNVSFNDHEEEIARYFDHEKLKSLVRIKRQVSALKNKKIYNILWLALLSVVEDCSNRKKDGNGLATRPSPVNCVYERYEKQIEMIAEDFEQKPHADNISSFSIELDARSLSSKNLQGKKIGAIIFSPPYANSFDYFESYKLEIVLGEYSLLSELGDFRTCLIRNYRIGQGAKKKSDIAIVEEICNDILERIPIKEKKTGIKDGRARLVPNMLCSYFFDMREVIKKCSDVLDKNGYMHIVVDQSAYMGVPVPTDTILATIAEKEGFAVREMIVCRSANTSGQQLKEYPYLKALLRETIIVLQRV